MIHEESLDSCFLNQPESIGVIVCCKNRETNLFKAIESWLPFKEISEIIILDYGSEKILDIKQKDPRIKLFRYESKYWHLSKAYNIAAQLHTKDIILKLECDHFLQTNFFQNNTLFNKQFIVGQNDSTKGLLFIKKSDFFLANGYNERLINWGWEDIDLYGRLKELNLTEIFVKKNSILHIDHPDHLRTKFTFNPYLIKEQTAEKNRKDSITRPWTKLDKMSSFYD